MENLTINQTGFYFLVKTKVQDYKGRETEIITIFTKEIWFEEVCIGIREGLIWQNNIKSCDIEIFTIRGKVQTSSVKYDRYYFEEPRKKAKENLLRKVS